MQNYIKILIRSWEKIAGVILILGLVSCETEFIPEGVTLEPEIVVEGYIEAGEGATPPFILLTNSVSFFNEFNPDQIEDLFIHNAEITVFDGAQEWPFVELCLNEIPPDLQPIILTTLGISSDSSLVNLCVYIESTFQLTGEIGKQYDLKINIGEKELTASTTIAPHVPLDNLWFQKPSEEATDTLLELWCSIADVPGQLDFYRYFTASNSEALRAPRQSVVDDALFDGQEFEFILPKSESFIDPPSIEEFGLFETGDTAIIKWANMDEEHFNFWSTLEFNSSSQGPFSSYTQVTTNITGGLGVWGGYSVSRYELIVEE